MKDLERLLEEQVARDVKVHNYLNIYRFFCIINKFKINIFRILKKHQKLDDFW